MEEAGGSGLASHTSFSCVDDNDDDQDANRGTRLVVGSFKGDVAQKVVQKPILYYSGYVHIGSPFKGNWAKGEALELGRLSRRSHRDPHTFVTDVAGLEI